MLIKVKNLVKEFNSLRAVDNISFEVLKGEIFGLLGPNGAGKTTTIRMLTGILKPDEGTAYINEYSIQEEPLKAKQLMGIVPEMANAYVDLSALRNLLLMGELYGIERRKRIERAEQLLRLFKLYDKRNQKVKTFSKGMKQRVIIAMALMNDAKILFLDEPTSGLDVESTRLIRDIINAFNKRGITILLTTHDIEEAGLLCDRVAIMNYGKIIALDRPEKLKDLIKSTSSIEAAFKYRVDKKGLKFRGVTEVRKTGDKYRLYTRNPEDLIPLLVSYTRRKGNKIIKLNTVGPSLEDVFIKLTKDGRHHVD